VEPATLPVSAFHGIGFGRINPLGDPAFRAIEQRGRFDEPVPDTELPAVDAEAAVPDRLALVCKALHFTVSYRQDTVLLVSHFSFSTTGWIAGSHKPSDRG